MLLSSRSIWAFHDATKYPTMHRHSPKTNNYLTENVNSVEVGKP